MKAFCLWQAFLVVALSSTAQSLRQGELLSTNQTAGFSSPVHQSYSAGKHGVCATGKVSLKVNATNVNIIYNEPTNQSVVTEFFQELTQVNSTLITSTSGNSKVVSGTYSVEVTLCFPANRTRTNDITTIQVLVPGTGLDKSYWDIAPQYSYVDVATSNGYATVAYNRLGSGLSDHPDPIQIVQTPMDIEIQHALVQLLRNGMLGGITPQRVVTVGHSYGSTVLQGQNAKYPKDSDATILTGFASQGMYLGNTFVANNPAIAALNEPARFSNLSHGYLVHNDAISFQLPFFRFPYFDPKIFNNQLAAKQPYTIGIEITNGAAIVPAPNYTGPVDIVLGQHDYVFCLGSCVSDAAAATIPVFYPAASNASQAYIVPNSGHCINAHYSAQLAFDHMIGFLGANGI